MGQVPRIKTLQSQPARPASTGRLEGDGRAGRPLGRRQQSLPALHGFHVAGSLQGSSQMNGGFQVVGGVAALGGMMGGTLQAGVGLQVGSQSLQRVKADSGLPALGATTPLWRQQLQGNSWSVVTPPDSGALYQRKLMNSDSTPVTAIANPTTAGSGSHSVKKTGTEIRSRSPQSMPNNSVRSHSQVAVQTVQDPLAERGSLRSALGLRPKSPQETPTTHAEAEPPRSRSDTGGNVSDQVEEDRPSSACGVGRSRAGPRRHEVECGNQAWRVQARRPGSAPTGLPWSSPGIRFRVPLHA